jgi:hypothetical protein
MTRVINPHFPKGDSPVTRQLTVNLADVLERKYPSGFHVPADIDIGMFLEFADDDWDHTIDIDALLAAVERLPDDGLADPARFGAMAAQIDDLERAVTAPGGRP